MQGLIIGDNFSDNPRTSIARANGAHRIASLLRKKNFQVEVIDFFNSWTIDELKLFVNKFNQLDFLGISITLGKLDNYKVNVLIELVKQLNPNIKIIAGGSNVLLNKFNQVDLYFKGFADGAIDDLVKYLETSNKDCFNVYEIKTHDIKNVINCTRDYGNYDLSNLKTEYTNNDFISNKETLTLETSRGCIFKCKFCSFPLNGKAKGEGMRDPDILLAEFIRNYELFGTTNYTFADDTYNDSVEKITTLYEKVYSKLPFKINFTTYARLDLMMRFPKTIDILKKSGLKSVVFGIETLNPKSAKSIGKGVDPNEQIEFIRRLKKDQWEEPRENGLLKISQ